ncbi:hypothetical protein [Antarcticirhabdus aurantiaca]|uniref:Uncharacterized protein n=1 Tax=Antarcticirhabdus aurantiaca TaxID=2606717 RepID=A0ACD4NNP9_9HYPH|nr:hypothetical protein [Antarcticirhabdus aurantiaca]WAJ28499.1 hypothetical protein OXU80_27455 [Jeongeuplla avenae]
MLAEGGSDDGDGGHAMKGPSPKWLVRGRTRAESIAMNDVVSQAGQVGSGGSLLMPLVLVLAGGLMGGLVSFLIELRYEDERIRLFGRNIDGKRLALLAFVETAVGMVGALAIQFVAVLIRLFPSNLDTEGSMLLLSISCIAGFGARRLLPRITSSLEKRIEQAERDAEAATKEASEAREKAEETAEVTRAIASAFRPDAPASEREFSIVQLTKRFETEPLNRSIAIPLARLHRMSGDLHKAIEVLDVFVNAKMLRGQKDKDWADGDYNRACYYSLLYKETGEEKYKSEALDILFSSGTSHPENKTDAISDRDFDAIKNDSKFAEITK